jgi:hypothetical protein
MARQVAIESDPEEDKVKELDVQEVVLSHLPHQTLRMHLVVHAVRQHIIQPAAAVGFRLPL